MELKDVIGLGGFIILIGGHVITFLKAKGMDEAQQKQWEKEFVKLHEIDEQQWSKIHDSEKWQISHEKESYERRLQLELKIAATDGNMGKLNGRLDSIEKKLDKLIDDFEKRVGRN